MVRDEPPYDYECFDHFRFIKICLDAYLATGNGRYLDWSIDYADGWWDVLMADHHAPMVFRLCIDRESRAYRLVRSSLHLGRLALCDRRERGCSSERFAAGPGRAAGFALADTAKGYRDFCCTHRPQLLYRHDGGFLGLSETIAVLCLPENGDRRTVQLFNAGKEAIALDVFTEDTDLQVVSQPSWMATPTRRLRHGPSPWTCSRG